MSISHTGFTGCFILVILGHYRFFNNINRLAVCSDILPVSAVSPFCIL